MNKMFIFISQMEYLTTFRLLQTVCSSNRPFTSHGNPQYLLMPLPLATARRSVKQTKHLVDGSAIVVVDRSERRGLMIIWKNLTLLLLVRLVI